MAHNGFTIAIPRTLARGRLALSARPVGVITSYAGAHGAGAAFVGTF